jgi:hypothetical protein
VGPGISFDVSRFSNTHILIFKFVTFLRSKFLQILRDDRLSQLSDGPLNGSNRLAIYELRQSETRPDDETTFLADHTFLYKIGSWRNFSMTF